MIHNRRVLKTRNRNEGTEMVNMQFVATVICTFIMIVAFVISYFQFKEKGFLFNNAYLYASKEERKRMNKTPYYRQSGVVFSFIGIIFGLILLEMATNKYWLCYIVILLNIVILIYAIVSSIQIEKEKR